jgi:hypothetical protein
MAYQDGETYHEVPASKYWYLGDTIGAVPKGFFKFFTTFVIIITAASTAIACLTDWWQRILALLFVGQLWYIGWITVGLTSLILFAVKKRHPKKGVKIN